MHWQPVIRCVVKLVFVVAVSMALPNRGETVQPDHGLLAEVTAAWLQREATVAAVRVTWNQKDITPKGAINLRSPNIVKSGEIIPPSDAVHEGKGKLLIDAGQCRITVERQIWSTRSKSFETTMIDSVYEQGRLTTLTYISGNPAPTGTLQTNQWNPIALDVAQWPLRAAFRGSDPKVMNGANLGVFTLARKTTLNGIPMVELIQERTELSGEAKIWVDPAQDYAARRMEQYDREGQLQHRTIINTRRDSSRVWVPAAWSTVLYRGTKCIRAVETQVVELSINPAIQPDAFQLDFPIGTRVTDSTGPTVRDYIIRESDIRVIPQQELGQKYVDLVRTEPGELVPGSRRGFWNRGRYVWWGLGLLALGLVILVLRAVRRCTGKTDS
jgi:hypothetical protein